MRPFSGRLGRLFRKELMQVVGGYFMWQNNENVQLTPHFNTKEFQCPEPNQFGTHMISVELIGCLEAVRNTFGKPLHIASAYRTSEYQQKLKAKGYETALNTSQHELGNAADISLAGLSDAEKITLSNIIFNFFKSIGTADTFIHVDTRRDKLRLWSYLGQR